MANVRAELEQRTPGSKAAYEGSCEVLAQQLVSTVTMPYPIYIRESKGSRVTDVDGNQYIDLTMGYGPHVLGHAPDVAINAIKEAAERGTQWGLHNPYQEPLARLIVDAVPCAEKVVFANSGTEATMFAVRAARAHTGKRKVAVFDGSYHGSHDYVLVNVDTDSPRDRPTYSANLSGIPGEAHDTVIMLPYRHEAAFDIIRENKDELAVVLIEPSQSSNPRLDCGDFLRDLRDVCRECGVLFLMDETITGFRLAYGGAQELYGITPDLATYGKAMGGGMPIGAIAGPSDIMQVFSRPIEQINERQGESEPASIHAGGTFAGNPVTMAAGAAAVGYMRDHREIYKHMAEQGTRMTDEINKFCTSEEIPAQFMSALSMFHMRFQNAPIQSARDLDPSLKEAEDLFYLHLLNNGVIIPGVHLGFISAAHSAEDIDQVIDAFKKSFLAVREQGLV